MDLVNKKRIRYVFVIATIIALSITAKKCARLGGKETNSLTLLNCFDMSSGTLGCMVKEGVKLYFYFHNIRPVYVESARHKAIQAALVKALEQGMSPKDAAKQAQKYGEEAAKVAKRRARHIIGPVVSCGWDLFEVVYYGGSVAQGFTRGIGTLLGTYAGGFAGEQRLGRFGFLVGSHLGSWFGSAMGLMVYDFMNGINYLIQFVQIQYHKALYTVGFEMSCSKNSFSINEF